MKSGKLPRTLLSVFASMFVLGASPPVAIAQSSKPEFRTLRVGVVVHEGVETLDFAGPVEVFAAAGAQMAIGGRPLFEVFTVAPERGVVHAHGGVNVEPGFAIADEPQVDLLVIPGGDTNVLTRDPAFMKWVREVVAPEAEIVMSVCTGAFVLAETGLLDGAEATTYHGAIENLRKAAPKAKVLDGRRVVDNGRIVTAGGVSCGIDGALHVVARLGGRRLAQSVADYMEFRWQPEPQLAGSYSDWCALGDDRTRLRQELSAARAARDWTAAEKLARELVKLDAKDGAAWYELGYALIWQERYDESIVANEEAAKLPGRPAIALYNVACAWARKREPEKALDALARAVDAGFDQRGFTEEDEDFVALRGDSRFQKLLDRMAPRKPRGEGAR